MKQALLKQYQTVKEIWRQNTALRRLALAALPVLLLGYCFGGLRTAMLLTGYLQLPFRVLLPGEPVENKPLQRAAAFAGGTARMLFFTGMMTHAVWPFFLMAAAQAAGLIILATGAKTDTELSLLPLLASSGFLLLGLVFSVRPPAVWMSLSGMLTLTLSYLLLHGKQNWNQLRMRFHLA